MKFSSSSFSKLNSESNLADVVLKVNLVVKFSSSSLSRVKFQLSNLAVVV